MTVTKYIDEKLIVSLVLTSILLFFLQKYLTRKFHDPKTGEVTLHAGIGNKVI